MQASLWFRYLFGEGRAIREVAESRSAFGTGIVLVFLTAIARNYDQTFIAEKPFLWLFGSLLFSFVSGTWLYLIVYGWFVRRGLTDADGNKPGFWSGWRGFMGLFWMTAPIAWLYAISVERFLDPLPAAKANLMLLGVVSLWRVLLMARVMQHLAAVPYYVAFFWILFAAAVEVLVVFFFGGAFAEAIVRGMGGMRNSPEENLVRDTLGTVFVVAFWTAPVALVLAVFVGKYRGCESMPTAIATPMRWLPLAVAAVCWIAVSIAPQIQLSRNYAVERFIAEGKPREALDYLSARQSGDFAPSRTLPPKPYERELFEELAGCLGAVQTNHAGWVRIFLINRLDVMMVHYGPRWSRDLKAEAPEEQIQHLQNGLRRYGPEAGGLLKLVTGLERIPEGQAWLATNSLFLQALQKAAREALVQTESGDTSEVDDQADWLSLSNQLHVLLPVEPTEPVAKPPETTPPVQP